MPNYSTVLRYWDIKYYYRLHCIRQNVAGNIPVSYPAFCIRLKKMNLHDAIYSPRVEYNVRHRKDTPIQDEVRRRQINKEQNIPVLDFQQIKLLEHRYYHHMYPRSYSGSFPSATADGTNFKPMIQPPKKSLWKRFISLFKKPC